MTLRAQVCSSSSDRSSLSVPYISRRIAEPSPERSREHRVLGIADLTGDLTDAHAGAGGVGQQRECTLEPLFFDEPAEGLAGLFEQHVDVSVGESVALGNRLGR